MIDVFSELSELAKMVDCMNTQTRLVLSVVGAWGSERRLIGFN